MSFNGPMSDITDNSHSLLEPPSPAYTNVTVRRAFIVWMYCGQRNKFKDVCNYFHHLEAWEDQLPPERRAQSRHHEFNLFSNQPPISTYLIDHFPRLYKEDYIERHYASKTEEIRNEKSVFNIEGLNEIAPKHGTTTHEIVEASRMIRKYCRIQMVSLKKFSEEFKQHARKCDLKYTVNNVVFYIKRKMVQAEIELEANYPKTLSFLNSTAENVIIDIQKTNAQNDCMSYSKAVSSCKEEKQEKKFQPLKILRKEEEDSKVMTKNYKITNNNPIDNTVNNITKQMVKDDNPPEFEIADPLLTKDIKSISIEDLTIDSPIKKERRFSGSRFMKLELEKFRKI